MRMTAIRKLSAMPGYKQKFTATDESSYFLLLSYVRTHLPMSVLYRLEDLPFQCFVLFQLSTLLTST